MVKLASLSSKDFSACQVGQVLQIYTCFQIFPAPFFIDHMNLLKFNRNIICF